MTTDDKAAVIDLVNRLPEHATLLDLARELRLVERMLPLFSHGRN